MLNRTVGLSLTSPADENRDHVFGPSNAPVVLVKYGDYQCPNCQEAHFGLQELVKEAGDSVKLVFRNFPLLQIHPQAQNAAEAAEAAGAQNKFWEMHDILLENQKDLDFQDLIGYAQNIHLDLARFKFSLLRGDFAARVRQDYMSGVRSGVKGTPTFFINGRRFEDPWDFNSLKTAIAMAVESTSSRRSVPQSRFESV